MHVMQSKFKKSNTKIHSGLGEGGGAGVGEHTVFNSLKLEMKGFY